MTNPQHEYSDLFPEIPPSMPTAGGPISRWLGRKILRLIGWRIEGEIPADHKLVMVAAPHTSNWDFVLAMLAIMALGIRVSYLMKKEAFVWPLGGLFRKLGGIPIDRTAADDTVEQIGAWYRDHEKVWVVITPEGTRAKVDRWKTGFLRIAQRADVPVVLVAWDFPNKRMVLGKRWPLSGDHVKDAEVIREYVNTRYAGKHPENQ
ncbi:lysophospholipid acyltransferase family protein [Teredinibacter franksiae]|uniref:lysophospholipid acyltransferase family protein n=1 Tax=Teredinibacter franksiae TaxID=2761453 RepID=UPI001FE4FC8C|nr:lysophospholipid acyltransferase family protein [Teredinibacter franksiae]